MEPDKGESTHFELVKKKKKKNLTPPNQHTTELILGAIKKKITLPTLINLENLTHFGAI